MANKSSKQPAKAAAAEAFTIEYVKKLVALVEKTDVSLVAWSRGIEKVVIRRGAVVAMAAAAPATRPQVAVSRLRVTASTARKAAKPR